MKDLSLIPCQYPRWARGGHAQTVLGHFLPGPRWTQKCENIHLPLEDGDTLVLSYLPGREETIVYLFHGLSGNAHSDYMIRTADLCQKLGYHVVLTNHRGCGDGKGLATHPYHSGRAEDLSAVIAYGKKRFPTFRHIAVGFSLSGNCLLLLLTGKRGTALPDAGVAVNAPINLARGAELLQKGFSRIYDFRFVRLCYQAIKDREEKGLIPRKYSIPLSTTLAQFDDLYTAPAGGFRDRHHYYESCSSRDHLRNIKTPTVMITSQDDPFVHYQDYLDASLSPTTHLHLEKHGGHMGYLTSTPTPLGTRRWLDYALHEYLKRLSK